MGNSRTCLHVNGQTEYSRCQGYVLHLVGPAWWTVGTEWNHHRGSVSNAIDAFEPSMEGETATVPRETRQSYPPAWQSSATCHKTGQYLLGNIEMGNHTPPAVLSRRCSFPLLFVSWKSQGMDLFMDRHEIHIVLSRCYLTIPKKMEKSSD